MPATVRPKKSRIKTQNEAIILDAALEVFSRFGYRGTTVDQIAEAARMSKPNLLYYFKSKEEIYVALLQRTLKEWLAPLTGLDPEGDPEAEIGHYIAAKIAMSRKSPEASRLFANEILAGAPHIAAVLSGDLKALVDRKAGTLDAWMRKGKLAKVDPYHLIFMIWATTQHYADFEVQIRAILGPAIDTPDHFATAEETLTKVILEGLKPRS